MAANSPTTKKKSSVRATTVRGSTTRSTIKPDKAMARQKLRSVEMEAPGRDELREAARVLKSKGSKKRDKKAAASVMSNYGSRRGGENRARNLTPEQRTEIARAGGLKRQAMARQQRELREAAADDTARKKTRRKA